MWRKENARMAPERMTRRQRLVFGDVEDGGRQPAALQRLDQVCLNQVPAPPDIDKLSTTRQCLEETPVQDATGLIGQRQQADQDVGLREEITKTLPTRMAADTLNGARRTIPARQREAEWFEPFQHGLPEQAQPHDANAPFRGLRGTDLAPNLLPLLGDEAHEIAMQHEHGHSDIFNHALRNAGLQHADERNLRRKLREIELIDPRSDR